MGVKDTETKEFLKKNDVFADVFNGTVFEGKQVIDPYSLKEMDTTLTATLYGKEGKSHPVQRYRDLVKCTSAMQTENGETMYLIFAIEEQSNVNHVLPIRVMIYDALQYNSQVDAIKREHRNEKKRQQGMDESESADESANELKDGYADGLSNELTDHKEPLTSGEFLSGFYKEDRVMPVMTMVINFSGEAWKAPRSLHELLADIDPALYPFVPDYKINLLSPYEMSDEEINHFQSDLREVLLYVKYSKDKEKLKEMTERDEKFKHLDRQTADVINVITNSKLKFDEKEGKKAVNMCKAIMDIREEGRVLQFIKDVRQFHFMDEPGMVVYLMEEFGLSKEEAEKKLKETS